MSEQEKNNRDLHGEHDIPGSKYYRELFGKHLIRLIISYIAPMVVLIVFFQLQYVSLLSESRNLHMKSIAENLAHTLDLFLRERLVNLANLIDDPQFVIPPSNDVMQQYLEELKRDNDAFIDIGFFDAGGIQTAYVGPYPSLKTRNYSNEEWYRELKIKKSRHIITDIYPGMRNEPHFTIGVSRTEENQFIVLRATMDPNKLHEYITSIEGSNDVYISVINSEGLYQVVSPEAGEVLEQSSLEPSRTPWLGMMSPAAEDKEYAYAWLTTADWALIVSKTASGQENTLFGMQINLIMFSLILILIIFSVVVIRAKRLVKIEREKDIVRLQLKHAAKLVSIGELAAGIAHEINNPLAIIASETGLMNDLMNPEFNENTTMKDLVPCIENIREAVFRCRDITSNLLSFVRKNDVHIKKHNIHTLIDEVLGGFVEHEMLVSNIRIMKSYCKSNPELYTDANQLKQVLLNIINNAADAITPPGKIIIATSVFSESFSVSITDTGKGITQEEIDKIFMPFYSTKEVGKGTGLGLSVSYSIIKNLGGKIEVESILGKGSKFTIVLPLNLKKIHYIPKAAI
ncbi:ATP-binding protein [candidate division KSB1 bacterium]